MRDLLPLPLPIFKYIYLYVCVYSKRELCNCVSEQLSLCVYNYMHVCIYGKRIVNDNSSLSIYLYICSEKSM